MHREPDVALPRKKRSIVWWLAGVVVVVLLLFVLQLFGPNPPVAVSRQTTYITEPLRPNGLPDYEQYVLDQYREGVTPENNAAVLLWQALFPADVQPQHFAAVATELGVEQIPSPDEALVSLHSSAVRQQCAAWFIGQSAPNMGRNTNETDFGEEDPAKVPILVSDNDVASWMDINSGGVESVLDQARQRPWTSDQLPPLAQWVQENQRPLDLIVEASQRPRYYAPSPTLIDNDRDMLVSMLLPQVQSVRDGGRALAARAMWHLGEGRTDEAWRDLFALHRLSRLVGQGHTLVEQLVGIAVSSMACDGTLTLLHHGKLSVEQARQIERDLAALPKFNAMATSLDRMERVSALDSFLLVGTGGGRELISALLGGSTNDFGAVNSVFDVVSVDWNLVLIETNRWYDRLAAAAKLPDWSAREAAFARIDADLNQLVVEARTPGYWAAGVVSRTQRSRLAASMLLSLFLPATHTAIAAEDRGNTTLDLIRLAAALAAYRAEHDAYPQELDELVPGVLQKLPVDLFHAKPFAYNRDGEGYLLYSLGENGTDDAGSNERLHVLKGRPLDELDDIERQNLPSSMAAGTDDHSIRVPRPAFKLPQFAPTTDEP